MAEPCAPWPIVAGCTFDIPIDPVARTPIQALAVQVASDILWALSGRQFSLCPVTVRPCGSQCRGDFDFWPVLTGTGQWINVVCCAQTACDCCYVCSIDLRNVINEIVEVKIGGAVVDPSTYRVDNGTELVRTSGDCWPVCQDLSLPDTEPNTFSVAYISGRAVPAGGSRAMAELAAEIIKACSTGPCRLPARVQEIVRQGETIQLINDVEFLRSGLTGLPTVDMWLTSVNPHGLASPITITSPDMRPTLRQTTWP